MGDDALAVAQRPRPPAAPRAVEPRRARSSGSRPSIEALYVPNIDEALDEESAKREFWAAFRVLGQWWADLPPY